MTEIDLWDDDDELEVEVEVPEVGKGEVAVSLDDSNLTLFSVHDLRKREAFAVLAGLQTVELDEGVYRFRIYKNAGAMFALRYALTGLKVKGSAEDLSEMKALADKAPVPAAVLSEDRKFINIRVPRTPSYTNLLKTMTARPLGEGDYRVTVARAQDLNGHNQALPKYVPRIAFADSVTALLFAPIPGFDGTLESLKSISVEELNVIGSNAQAWKNLKNSKKTLAEKMGTMGISSLYDLIFFMPRRYIDKSTPQNIRDLIAGESATILGTIAGISSVGGIGGTRFKIESNGGGQIDAVFFRQEWLQTKFKRGEEVLVTGKVGFFNRELNLGGTSIEHSAEAAILPIVPIYKQSESKGITTNVILNAQRELFSRMGENLKMPPYFAKSKEIVYASAVRELHLPTSLAESKKSRELLAYMEFVQMQIIMHELKQSKSQETGLINAEGPSKLQRQAISSLPFTMTRGQQNAVSYLNDEMAAERPVSVLLNADVGAGKTLLAQLACLRAVEAGRQAIIVAPATILARQLYDTLQTLLSRLSIDVDARLLLGDTKATERKKILKGLSEGTVQIAVGSTSLLSEAVEYNDLGFVCFDEQQKFGVNHRTKILSRRSDDRVPDFMMQTATPVPRSTAQVFYGDMDMIELDDKPEGRLPIETEWLNERPQEVLEQLAHPVWEDIKEEASKGNQTFIITPLVNDSESIDAASVKKTHEVLSNGPLSSLNVGIVHGQMKPDLARDAMADFRAKKYDVLVASTAVEVGVDIPDATRVVVLSADRLGASSLHQIRGRVGRSNKPSTCSLISQTEVPGSIRRLQALVDSSNGYDIAQVDLETRGEGQLFGVEQSGGATLRFGSILTHRHLVEAASKEADRILASPLREMAIQDAKLTFNAEERFV